MRVFVDTSVWIEYFRGGHAANHIDVLIDENVIVINDIVLAELVPFLKLRKQNSVIRLLHEVTKLAFEIDWEEIIRFQTRCLQAGLNGIGIPDLMIGQNAKQNKCAIYSLDRHFHQIRDVIDIDLYEVY